MGSDEGNGGRVDEVAAFREGREALPPLTERIERGAEGARAFERLMHALLLVQAERNRFVYAPIAEMWDQSRQVLQRAPAHGVAENGMPGFRGLIAFQFGWHWDETNLTDRAAQIENALRLGSKGNKKLKHWILVTPRDIDPSERAWHRELGTRDGLEVHHWGQTCIEQLLRQCPALLALYYPQAARAYFPDYEGTDLHAFATRYREKLTMVHNRLKTIGIPPEARPREGRAELPLDKLFIPLRLIPEAPAVITHEAAQLATKPEALRGVPGAKTLASALMEGGSAVVLADPGMGKSTLLAYLALAFAGAAPLDGFTCPSGTVPLHISLREFVRRQRECPGLSFLEYLEIDARERHGLADAHRVFFEATLRMGDAVVLLDGLDEVGNETARHAIATAIHTFQAEYRRGRFWVTSRIYGYTDNVRLPRSFAHYHIGRLDDEQIDDFVTRWYTHQLRASPQEAADHSESLRSAVRRTPSVRMLAGNPLLLTLMAFIHHGQHKLPKDRGELYEKCIEMLLNTWQEAKRRDGEGARGFDGLTLNVPTQKDYLAHLAFFLQQKYQREMNEEARGLVSRREAIAALAARHCARARRERPAMTELEAADEMERFLNYICDETGLLIDRGNERISFIHLSFQEYLAAWVFICGTDLPRGPGFFIEHLGDPAWEEVLLLRLYIVLLGGGGGETEFDQILGAVLRSLERKSAPAGWLTLVRAIRDDLEFTDRDRKEILARALGYWLGAPVLEGMWFNALDEVKLFSTRARELLQAELAQGRANAHEPADAVALLHLEARLFGFPPDAADALRRRADLQKMLADLVAFAGEPAIRALLAERATVADWSRAMRALGPEVYQMAAQWTLTPPAPAVAEAATALLWEEIIKDLESRVAVAAPGKGHELAETLSRTRGENHPERAPLLHRSLARDALVRLFAHTGLTDPRDSTRDRATTSPIATKSRAPVNRPPAPSDALSVAHVAYTSLMNGTEPRLFVVPNLTDAHTRVSHLLCELVRLNFQQLKKAEDLRRKGALLSQVNNGAPVEPGVNIQVLRSNLESGKRALEADIQGLQGEIDGLKDGLMIEIASPAPELRPLLEACGLIPASAAAGNISTQPTTATTQAPKPQPEPEKPPLFTWLHLSDIHFGHPSATQHWDQALVLDALHKDIADHRARGVPTPSAILITGDIAYSGGAPQYDLARSWLDGLARLLGVAADRIFLVPGNHDIDRTVDKAKRIARLVDSLRDGREALDAALADPDDREALTSRLAPYLSFASAYLDKADPLGWTRTLTSNNLPTRLIGLSTPLLSAAGDVDREKLRLGNAALATTLTNLPPGELVLVLTHHPLRGGWLADQGDADRWIQGRAHVHLYGHVHEHDSDEARSGAGSGLLRIAAGATYGDRPGVPASHGYSIAAVVPQHDGTLCLRIWPRRWSETKRFVADVHSTPEGRPYAEHALRGLRAPG